MKILNVSYYTIRRYDKIDKLSIKRTETGRRIVKNEDMLNPLDSLICSLMMRK
ncbi:MAG: MerR family DNA-binding transcriptional regulator [Desulfovibrio sp.]|nr:MerR family DNA-binding transcriptional regulator [Desulfovibrio sp.]